MPGARAEAGLSRRTRPRNVVATMEKLFGLRERGATVRTEILGGAMTFITMA